MTVSECLIENEWSVLVTVGPLLLWREPVLQCEGSEEWGTGRCGEKAKAGGIPLIRTNLFNLCSLLPPGRTNRKDIFITTSFSLFYGTNSVTNSLGNGKSCSSINEFSVIWLNHFGRHFKKNVHHPQLHNCVSLTAIFVFLFPSLLVTGVCIS